MLVTFKTPDDKNVCIAWGEVWSEPFTRKVGLKKLTYTQFYLRYDMKKGKDGKNYAKSVAVGAWGRLAGMCQLLKKHQEIMIFGLIQRDEYNSTKYKSDKFKITIQVILPITSIWNSLLEQMAEDNNQYPTAVNFTEYSGEGLPQFDDYDEIV